MDELKPCPFCGGEAELIETGAFYNKAGYVQCRRCGACSRFALGENYIDICLELWNFRHEPQTPGGAIVPAGNERLEK